MRNPRVSVRDLIRLLGQLDPDLGVVVEGYEGGYTSPRIDGIASYAVQDDGDGIWGELEVVRDSEGEPVDAPDGYRAVLLTRWEPDIEFSHMPVEAIGGRPQPGFITARWPDGYTVTWAGGPEQLEDPFLRPNLEARAQALRDVP